MKRFAENKPIITAVAIGIIIAIILCSVAVLVYKEIKETQTKDAKQFLVEVTNSYRTSLNNNVSSKFQLLNSISSYIEETNSTKVESIVNILQLVNEQNDFHFMGIVLPDGKGYFAEIGSKKIIDANLKDMETVKSALKGEQAMELEKNPGISKGNDLFYYAVPICAGDDIYGTLVGVAYVSDFLDILEEPLLQGKGYLHLSDSKGNLLIQLEHRILNSSSDSILSNGDIPSTTRNQVKNAIAKGNDYFTTFPLDIGDSWVSLIKLDFNDWYVISVVPRAVLNSTFNTLTKVSLIFVGLVMLFFGVLFYFIYRIIRRSKESIYRLAYYDELTGIPNKNKFAEMVQPLLKTQEEYALAQLDIVRFKFLNESFGFETGNQLLKHIAEVLRNAAKSGEYYYREGADDFGMLLSYETPALLTSRLQEIQYKIGEFSKLQGIDYNIVCDIGVKVIDWNAYHSDLQTLMDRVSLTLAQAKKQHEGSILYFDEALYQKAKVSIEIENSMYNALETREFQVYLQPKIDLRTGKVNSAEALVRWQPKNDRMFYPDEFIPIFEKNGFITKLDLYMLNAVLKQQRQWIDEGYEVVPISINQSRVLLFQSDYLSHLKDAIDRYDMDPSLIILEITESVSFDNIDRLEACIQAMHSMGIRVSMDDFGSGYSSLNTLKSLSIDELKLDKEFLNESSEQVKGETIIKNIIKLSKELSITTVAEGIETLQQLEFLKSIGCDIGQGYYFAKPLAIEKFEEFTFKL